MNAWKSFKQTIDRAGLGVPARKIWRSIHRARVVPAPAAAIPTDARYEARIRAEKDNYREVANVHDLPAIFHYWSNKYLAPKVLALGFAGPDDFFVNEFLRCWATTQGAKRFLSIGAGNCDTEARIARKLIDAGHRDFAIECLEINEAMLQRGRENAARQAVEAHIVPVESDFNTWKPGRSYDCIMANQSLHHVLRLEHLFDSVSAAIGPAGHFIIYDIIGRNGHMRWPEALAILERFWAQLPSAQRYNHLLGRREDRFVNWDCSSSGFEGVRAQDILPLLMDRFSFHMFLGFSNFIDPFVDRAFGHNFDPADPVDRAFIDKVEAEDELQIRSGNLKPTHMFAVVSASPPVASIRCLDHLTPQFCVRNPGELPRVVDSHTGMV
jgi:SAM-dependent methyltransferase